MPGPVSSPRREEIQGEANPRTSQRLGAVAPTPPEVRNEDLGFLSRHLPEHCLIEFRTAANLDAEESRTQPFSEGTYALAYDAARQEVVLFGGITNAGLVNDTWVWNGSDWTQRFPATSPPARAGHAMAYDSARGQVVLFGGSVPNVGYLDDTWTWDGVTWMQRFPPVSPSPRNSVQGLAYDAGRADVVLFGGEGPGATSLGDTWTWDGTSWSQAQPAGSPSARGFLVVAYDVARGETVLFGGHAAFQSSMSDTWTWNGNTWTQKAPATSPPARSSSGMAADTIRSQLILFGGVQQTAGPVFDDTWAWNGVDWSLQSLTVHPSARTDHGMAYDAARGQVVLFGGSSGAGIRFDDTWVWGSSFAAQVQPPINADGSSVFHSKRGVVPLKFTLTVGGSPTCDLPPATISLFRTSGGTLGGINESDYIMPADSSSNFRVSGCQYVYNLGTSLLGVGTYQVNISIGGVGVGTATFGLD
jgi:hypothetical protein